MQLRNNNKKIYNKEIWNDMYSITSLGPIVDISVMESPSPVMESPLAYGNILGKFNTWHYTLVHGFCFFKLLFIGPKELNSGGGRRSGRNSVD